MRNILELTPSDIDHILAEAPKRCYCEIADEMDIGVHTVRRIVRNHERRVYGQDTLFYYFK